MKPISLVNNNDFLEALKDRAFGPGALADKTGLRRRLKRERESMDPRAARFESRRIAERIETLPPMQRASTVACYMAHKGEADTLPVLKRLLGDGKTLALPRVVDQDIRFYRVKDLDADLAVGGHGIREPDPDRCPEIETGQIDVFLVPGVGFDIFGHRVGFGGGFYDRALIRRRASAAAVGLAYDFQVVHAIRPSKWDIPMDFIVTGGEIHRPSAGYAVCPGPEDTRALGAFLKEKGYREGTAALHGDLGTGKTEWVKGLAEAYGSERDVSSPTFVFHHEYRGEVPIQHIDGYRIEEIRPGEEEFWTELVRGGGIVAVEWAERLGTLIPKSAIHWFGRTLEDGAREWILFTPLESHKTLWNE